MEKNQGNFSYTAKYCQNKKHVRIGPDGNS